MCVRLVGSVKNAFQFPERQGTCLGENKKIIIVKKMKKTGLQHFFQSLLPGP